MNHLDVISDLGIHADLLTKSDQWLDERRRSIAQQTSLLLEDLRNIIMAQKVKQRIQQNNSVAVSYMQRIDGIDDRTISIMPLNDAIELADDSQLAMWRSDGYEVR